MHQSIPAVPSTTPPPLRADPWALAFSLPRMSIPPGLGRKKRAKPLLRQYCNIFSLTAQSNTAVLDILMCDFLFQVMSSFVITLGF